MTSQNLFKKLLYFTLGCLFKRRSPTSERLPTMHSQHHHREEDRLPQSKILHVATMITNPVSFKSRVRLYKEFAAYMKQFPNVVLWTAEGRFPGREWEVTSEDDPHHLQLEVEHELWHKENILNVLIEKKISVECPDWENIAWIDADVIFARPDWVEATLEQLQKHPVVQMFSECMDLSDHFETVPRGYDSGVMGGSIYKWYKAGFVPTDGYSHFAGHFGYAWAMTRQAYEIMGGLLDIAIVGSADYLMVHGLLGDIANAISVQYTRGYKDACIAWGERVKKLPGRVGYVRGLLMHHWHGPKAKRGYSERQRILDQHRFDPARDLALQDNGVLRWNTENPAHATALQDEMIRYFRSRDEDASSDLGNP
jgi:hypothetical protein